MFCNYVQLAEWLVKLTPRHTNKQHKFVLQLIWVGNSLSWPSWLQIPIYLTILIFLSALSWERPLPQNFSGLMLDKAKSLRVSQVNSTFKLPEIPSVLQNTNCKTNVLKLDPPNVIGSPFRASMKEKLKKSTSKWKSNYKYLVIFIRI